MKIYTKKGDSGETSLLGGARVPKFHLRIESYGTVDELNSYIGLLRDHLQNQHDRSVLLYIQDRLFTLGSSLAVQPGKDSIQIPEIKETDIEMLEKEIDTYDLKLPPLKSFILPGGHPAVSHAHVARCICRRAERRCVELSVHEEVNPVIIRYLNRLSDYLFTLSRGISLEFQAEESPWIPKM